MKPELQQELYDRYPRIFRQKDLPGTETRMCDGIDCEDGWFHIIDNMCEAIQTQVDNCGIPQVEATQVKQKLGGLRFYTDCKDNTIFGIILSAMHASHKTCERCGSLENVDRALGSHIQMLCAKCRTVKPEQGNKAYVVTAGDYSDYHIVGVFTNIDLAMECRKLAGTSNDIEIWGLDSIPDHPNGLYPYEVVMERDGTVVRNRLCGDGIERDFNDDSEKKTTTITSSFEDRFNGSRDWYSNASWMNKGSKKPVMTHYMFASDEQHAVKIANERRTQLIALNKWGNEA